MRKNILIWLSISVIAYVILLPIAFMNNDFFIYDISISLIIGYVLGLLNEIRRNTSSVKVEPKTPPKDTSDDYDMIKS